MAADTRPILSLADLERADPQAPTVDGERRFCCPLPACADKPVDQAHRTLSVNTATGLWTCYRCQAGGKLQEHWTPLGDRRSLQRQRLAQAFTLPPPAVAPSPPEWLARWEALALVAETPGAAYLASRGIPVDVATAAGVRWAPSFYHRPAIVFPITDTTDAVVALHGRHTDGREDPKAHTGGPKKYGVFATPGALLADPLVLVEGPLDALALAACGVPAVALVGVSGPAWLTIHAALRRVVLALDHDTAGDDAAEALAADLARFGAHCSRLRPAPWKDWADALVTLGVDGLTAALARTLDGKGDADIPLTAEPPPEPSPPPRSLAIRIAWAYERGWLAVTDLATGDVHEVLARDCPDSWRRIVRAGN
jgi:hypothetical protein